MRAKGIVLSTVLGLVALEGGLQAQVADSSSRPSFGPGRELDKVIDRLRRDPRAPGEDRGRRDGRDYDRGRGRDQDLSEITRLVEDAMEAADDWRLSYAQRKFEAAKLRVEDLRSCDAQRSLLRSLEIVISDLGNSRKGYSERARFAQDCGREILRKLRDYEEDLDHGNDQGAREVLRRALRQMDDVESLVSRARDDDALDALYEVDRSLRDYRDDRDIEKARDAIRVIEDKVGDRSMTRRDKMDVTRDCARVFRDAIERSRLYDGGHPGGGYPDEIRVIYPRTLEESLNVMERVSEYVERNREEAALKQLAALKDFVDRQSYDRELQRAEEVLGALDTFLRDSRNSEFAKINETRKAAKSFANQVKRSEIYRRERGIDYRGAQTFALGKTDLFSKSRYETRTLVVPSPSLPVRALRVIARDDSVAIQDILVVLDGGKTKSLGGDVVLSENDGTYFDIDLKGLVITQIQVTASSAAIFGTKGRVEVLGVK